MPVDADPTPVVAWPHQINVPAVGLSITVQILDDGSGTGPNLDDVHQDLIDYLQAWPGRMPEGDVTGSRYATLLYAVTPNIPGEPAE